MTRTCCALPVFSIVVPTFNEERNLPLLHARTAAVMQSLGEPWELVLVNDGSHDRTLEVMQGLRDRDPHIAIVNLSRNFGKEIATTGPRAWRRGDRRRCRPAGSARVDTGNGRCLAPRL